ncbi:MAG: hypothetical protein KKC29_00055 [Alphaproteobacteria bacterium]|nr:hypothetical protein [Alphaproteobacteria bacterium]MBU2126656.1 hypothetical protein [Alphaproteobacteria bacterium]MBU2209299.1 hypothetical protein [Alphaproteobacteria bacterium]MBU2289481.1 hypothetical protein [Alphaproteobacteria bacterium]MBU2397682.1 hypothetical protein [Alphaproteobacteria bacterium]
MRPPPYLRALTPWGRALLAAGVLGAALIGLQGLGFRWDPLGLAERRARAAEVRAAAAAADASARRLEVEGGADQVRRLEAVHHRTRAVAEATARVTTQAGRADDAEIPLEPDRAARLGGHDRELCRLAPAICGAAAADVARGGDDALRAGAVAADADPGRP